MPKFYETEILEDGDSVEYFILVNNANGTVKKQPISEELYHELNALQREFWKLEKREQRHTVHLDAIPEYHFPHASVSQQPENVLLAKLQGSEIDNAFGMLTPKQQRRLVLRFIFDLPIKEIANIEHCSERAVKYTLKMAKERIKAVLGPDYLKD